VAADVVAAVVALTEDLDVEGSAFDLGELFR
jgi:hypothetical protein